MNTSLMLMVTLGCNSECAHCCFACNTNKLHLSMSGDEMASYITQAHDYGISAVVFNGGEPTLLDLSLPMDLASRLGMYIDVRTNAFWAKDYNTTLRTLRDFQHRGLNRLGLSYDKYHAKEVPYEHIMNTLQAARKLCLNVYLDWVGLETREQIQEYLHLRQNELRYVGPPLKTGRAVELSDEHFMHLPIESLEKGVGCSDGLPPSLTIFPGDCVSLHPCCWVNPALIRKIGSNGWMEQLREEMRNSPMVNYLRDFGVSGLIEMAKREKPELLKSYYSHPCEACYDLLGSLFPEEAIKCTEGRKHANKS